MSDITFELGAEAGDDVSFDIPTPGTSIELPISSDDVTGPANADMFRSADVVDNFTTIATSLNVPARAADREAVVLPYVVTNAGTTLSGQLLNASLLAAYTHATSVRAAAIAQISDVLTVRDQITPGPTAWAECGLGPDGYDTPDIDAARGYWKCDTLNPSPSTSMRIRVTARTLTGSNAAAGYQEWHSEPGDSEGVSGEGGSADRFEYAAELAELMADFFEWGDTPGEPEIGQSSVAGAPAGVWVEREMDLTFATGVLAFRVRSDLLFDYVDPDDGSTWITLRTFTHGPTSLAASNNAVEQWIGRGDGRFDVARVQKWHDGTLVMDADFTTATEGATEIDDAVLESAPGVPAVWEAQLNAVVGVPAASGGGGGAVDSVNGETGAVVLDAADVGVLRPEGPVTHSAANEAAMLALSAVRGDVCARIDLAQSLLYLTADDPTNASSWTTLRFGTEDPRARANHTGTQEYTTITGLGTLATLSAIPNNGVRKILRDAYLWDAASGAQAWTVDTATAQGGGVILGEVQNDYTEFTEWMDAGTWTLEIWHTTGSSTGIMTLTLDGASVGATIDGYTAGAVRNNRTTRTGIAVATSGLHTLRVAMATKNASSSGYRSGLQAFAWRRTA